MSDYTQYDRITDILMYLNSDITLTFVVALSRKTQSGDRKFYHYEVAKQSQYRDGGELYNIKRNMSFFFTIDIKNDFTQNIILRPRDVLMLNDIISRLVLPWYQAGTKEYAFQIVNGNLILKEYIPAIYTQSEIKYIQFEPIVMQDKNDKFSFGINMNLSNMYSVSIELEKFMDFVYLLRSDMYTAACSLCNYAKISPYGIGIYRPYGLGGGRIDDPFSSNIDDNEIQAGYNNITINSVTKENDKNNNFLNNSKTKTRR